MPARSLPVLVCAALSPVLLLSACQDVVSQSGESGGRAEAKRDGAPEQLAQADKPAGLAAAAVGQWPRWRGAHLDGISRETSFKTQWDEPPAELWKKQVGTGFASIAVAGGRAYTLGHAGGQDTVYCFDAQTGDEVWSHSYDCKLVSNLHEGGPAATPTVEGGVVYTLSKEGHLFCLTAGEGNVVWQRELKQDLDVEMPQWGFSSSPLIHGDLLIVDGGRTAAYHKKTGELVWKSDPYEAGYGSAMPMRAGGEELVVVLNNEVLHVLRASDGGNVAKTKWETSFRTSSITPIIVDDTIFISTGYNRGCALLRLVGDKLEYVYENKNMRNHMNNCVLWEGHLYGIDGNAHNARTCTVACIDHATGELKWKEQGLGCGSLMVAGGKLIILSDEGKLVIAAASPEGFQPLAEAQILEGKCWTVPVLAGGLLYARNASGDLVCVDLRSNDDR